LETPVPFRTRFALTALRPLPAPDTVACPVLANPGHHSNYAAGQDRLPLLRAALHSMAILGPEKIYAGSLRSSSGRTARGRGFSSR